MNRQLIYYVDKVSDDTLIESELIVKIDHHFFTITVIAPAGYQLSLWDESRIMSMVRSAAYNV